MHCLNGALQPIAVHHYADGQLARALRDRDDVHVFVRDGTEDSAGQPGSSAHAFADDRQQADVFIHFDGMQIAVRQFQREVGLERLHRQRPAPLFVPGSKNSGGSWNW